MWEQLSLDFIEIKELEAKENAPLTADDIPYFDNPKCDNDYMLNCQFDYVINHDKTALNRMYTKGLEIAKKFINTIAKKNKHIAHLSPEEKEAKAHNAIVYMIERYMTVRRFGIKKSFTGYLFLRVEHELFYQTKVDNIVQFVDLTELLSEAERLGIEDLNCIQLPSAE
jgi:hypothetical protein